MHIMPSLYLSFIYRFIIFLVVFLSPVHLPFSAFMPPRVSDPIVLPFPLHPFVPHPPPIHTLLAPLPPHLRLLLAQPSGSPQWGWGRAAGAGRARSRGGRASVLVHVFVEPTLSLHSERGFGHDVVIFPVALLYLSPCLFGFSSKTMMTSPWRKPLWVASVWLNQLCI